VRRPDARSDERQEEGAALLLRQPLQRHDCDQPLAHADKVEAQVAAFVAAFRPSAAIRDAILDRLANENHGDEDTKRRRRQLKDRRRRLSELFEMGDIERTRYVSKRDAIDAELDSLSPGPSPDLDGARAVLEDFAMFWQTEMTPSPAASCSHSFWSASGSTVSAWWR
jgi:hypothetical protein